MPAATVRLLDPKNPNRLITDGLDPNIKPHYTVQEVGKVFFGKNSNWIRYQEQEGRLFLDGAYVGPHREDDKARYYTLPMVEKIAHALAKGGYITVAELKLVLAMVDIQAHLWRFK